MMAYRSDGLTPGINSSLPVVDPGPPYDSMEYDFNEILGNITFPHSNESGVSENIIKGLNTFAIPIIIIIGVVGNMLSLTVFMGTHLRYQSSSVYLACLNAADTLFLLCLSVGWFGFIEIHFIHNVGWCQGIVYLSYVGSFMSVWTVVSFTMERFIVVFKPLHHMTWCSTRKALLVVGSLLTVALLIYSYALWTTDLLDTPARSYCVTMPRHMKYVRILVTIDSVVTLVIPSIIIIFLNVGIILKIWNFVMKQENKHQFIIRGHVETSHSARCMLGDPHKQQSVVNVYNKDTQQQPVKTRSVVQFSRMSIVDGTVCKLQQRKQKLPQSTQLRTTRSLLVVSTVFVVLNLPSHAFRTQVTFNRDLPIRKEILLWQHVFQLLSYVNFSVNFFLYCLCSRQFRSALSRLVQKWKRTLTKSIAIKLHD